MYDYDFAKLFILEYSKSCVCNKSGPQFYGVVHQTSMPRAPRAMTIYRFVYTKFPQFLPYTLIVFQIATSENCVYHKTNIYKRKEWKRAS